MSHISQWTREARTAILVRLGWAELNGRGCGVAWSRWGGDGTDNGPRPDRERVDSGRGQNRTLRLLSTLWPPVFAGEQDVGPPKG